MKFAYSVISAVVLVVIVNARICPNYQPDIVKHFDLNAYAGQWYEIYRLPAPFEIDSKCVNAFYTLESAPQGPYVKVDNKDQVRGYVRSKIGYGIQPNASADLGALFVTFNSSVYPEDATPNYNVLATDYDTYSLVYYCKQVGPEIIQFSWILGRATTLSPEVTAPLFAEMDTLGVNQNQFHQTSQTNCKQYPTKNNLLF